MSSTKYFIFGVNSNTPFCVTYPRLFSISCQKEALVGDVWEVNEVGGAWEFLWRRNLFLWEGGLLENLFGELHGWVRSEREDVWWWKLKEEGVFTVSSFYELLAGLMLPPEPLNLTKKWCLGPCGKARPLQENCILASNFSVGHRHRR
jgi:hypothetical protein